MFFFVTRVMVRGVRMEDIVAAEQYQFSKKKFKSLKELAKYFIKEKGCKEIPCSNCLLKKLDDAGFVRCPLRFGNDSNDGDLLFETLPMQWAYGYLQTQEKLKYLEKL